MTIAKTGLRCILKRHLFIATYVIIDTCTYDLAHDGNVVSSKVYINFRPKAATGLLQQKPFLKTLQYSEENTYAGYPFL